MVRQDVARAFRSLRRAPGFSTLAIVTLGVGMAANTSIFSLVDGALLQPLPYAAGPRLVHITHPSSTSADARFSIPEIRDLRRQAHAFDAVVEYHSMAFQLYGLGEPQRVQTGVVSDNFFDVLGVRPLLGRLFLPGEEAVGAPPVVLLSYRYWVNMLGADPHVVGSTFTMNDRVHTVVGVLPPLPTYPDANDIWMPAGACPFRSAPAAMASRTARLPTVFARLAPGESLAQASAEMALIDRRFRTEDPAAYPAEAQLHSTVRPVSDEMAAGARPVLLLLFGTAIFLMLAASANFASLTLARQSGRARELALRQALGCGAWEMYRQLAIESVILTLAGGVLGAALASGGVGLLRTFAAQLTPRAAEIHVSAPVLGFSVGTCLLVGCVVAAVPFFRFARGAQMAQRLRQGNSGAMAVRAEGRLRRAFVVVQVCVSFVLLVAAGLVSRSVLALQSVELGFDPASVVTARLPHNFTEYPTNALLRDFGDRLLARLSSIRGATAVAISNTFPLNGRVTGTISFTIAGASADKGAVEATADYTSISPQYFSAAGIPLLRGRVFTAADRDTLSPPVIVSRRLAARFWRGRDPLGTAVSFDHGAHWSPVVGIVGDVHQYALDEDLTDEIYVPTAAAPPADIRVLIRATGPTARIVNQLKDAVHAVDEHEPVASVQTLEAVRGTRLLEPRVRALLVLGFAVSALVLAGAGLAGVVGYTVSQRIPEISIRLALGAGGGHVVGLVAREGIGAVLIGIVAGAAVSVALGRLVSTLLFHVRPSDPVTYALVSLAMILTTLVACLVPARRALAADPGEVLRSS